MCASRSATLILGFDPRTALAVARSLHVKSIPVIIGLTASWETPVRSRAVQAYVKLPDAESSDASFLRALQHQLRLHRVDTVIPVTDRALLRLSPHVQVLRESVQVASPSAQQIALVLDKSATAEVASKLGIPVPRTVCLAQGDEYSDVTESLRFPVFAKSRDKAEVCRRSQLSSQDARYCRNPAELAAVRASSGSDLLVQEYIPGQDVGLAVLMHRGRVVNAFQYRARKLQPAEGGVCVLACSEVVDPLLLHWAVRLLRHLRWEGMAQLDFRQDRNSGRTVLLEINGRFWGSTAVALRAGADFPYQWWQLLHGQTPVVLSYRPGVLVRWLEGDLRRLFAVLKCRRRHQGRVAREILTFFTDFRPPVRGMFWSWRDPLPALQTARNLGRCWLLSRWEHLRHRAPAVSELPDDTTSVHLQAQEHFN